MIGKKFDGVAGGTKKTQWDKAPWQFFYHIAEYITNKDKKELGKAVRALWDYKKNGNPKPIDNTSDAGVFPTPPTEEEIAIMKEAMERDGVDDGRYIVPVHGMRKYGKTIEFDSNSMIDSLKEELEQCPNVITVNKIKILKTNPDNFVQHVITDIFEQEEKRFVNIVAEGKWYTVETDVEIVTTNGSKQIIPDIKTDKEKITTNGIEKIATEKYEMLSVEEEKTQYAKQETDTLKKFQNLKKEDLQKKQEIVFYQSKKTNAQYVKEILRNVQCILIMNIQLDSHEDSYVVGATTDLECLEMILKVLKKQYNIYNLLQQTSIQNNKIILKEYGVDNWQFVRPFFSRYFAALQRHLITWWIFKTVDPEFAQSHLRHAECCLRYLIWGEMHREEIKE